ncbi:hypothetical protein D3C84_852600 [compost metagenome]
MAPAGFGKTLEQGFFVGIQVQDIALDMPVAHFLEQFRKTRQVAWQVTCVDGHRYQRLRQLGVDQGALGQFRQQAGGQVVDAIEAAVLKHVEGCAFTGAGAATDNDHAHF